MPSGILHPIVWGTSVDLLAVIPKKKKFFDPDLEVNFLEKLPQLVVFQNFQSF